MNDNTSVVKVERRTEMPPGEQEFLDSLMQFMRGLKRSQDRAVAQAARDWEGTIAFRIRLTMQSRERRKGRRGLMGRMETKAA